MTLNVTVSRIKWTLPSDRPFRGKILARLSLQEQCLQGSATLQFASFGTRAFSEMCGPPRQSARLCMCMVAFVEVKPIILKQASTAGTLTESLKGAANLDPARSKSTTDMRFVVEEAEYAFRPNASQRSEVLKRAELQDDEVCKQSGECVAIPLKREWVELWDTEAELANLSQEELLGVVKVRPHIEGGRRSLRF